MPSVRSSKDRRSSRIQARTLSVIQVPQESQNTNLNVTDDADNHSSPQLNDQMMNLVQSLTSSVTSLQQQVSEMAKKLEPGNNVNMSVVNNRNPGQVDNLVNPRNIGVNSVNQRNITMNYTCSTTTSVPEEVLPGLNLGTEHVQFQQFVNDTNNNMGCINNLSAIARYNGNQPLENSVNLVGNESSSRYYMHQAVPLWATISKNLKRQI
jgi:hypothetical protein